MDSLPTDSSHELSESEWQESEKGSEEEDGRVLVKGCITCGAPVAKAGSNCTACSAQAGSAQVLSEDQACSAHVLSEDQAGFAQALSEDPACSAHVLSEAQQLVEAETNEQKDDKKGGR